MRDFHISRRMMLFCFIAILSRQLSGQTGYKIVNSWDFENESLGEYTDEEVRKDFEVNKLFSHQTASIVSDKINGVSTKVMRITHFANKLSSGFQLFAKTGHDYNEVYLSYNWKFSEEFNSTSGGKLPGMGALPNYASGSCPEGEQGFGGVNLFKYGGWITTYHYDNTKGNCPWSGDAYPSDYVTDTIFLMNGNWYNITQRFVVNSFTNGSPNEDGIRELWIDGKLIYRLDNLLLMLKDNDTLKIDEFRLSNFYGGSTSNYMPLTECFGYIDNIKIYQPTDDPTFGTYKTHSTNTIIQTPNEITDRKVYYDKLLTNEGTLQNSEYGSHYSSCIDEVYLIDAGEGNKVRYQLGWTIGGGDALMFYDGNQTDSKCIRRVEGSKSANNQVIESSGRYLFVRFSSNTDAGSVGFTGTINFLKADNSEIINNPPKIIPQTFQVTKAGFTNKFIGNILATDADVNQKLTYSIVSGNESGLFMLNSQTGGLTTNREDIFSQITVIHEIQVKVSDNSLQSKSASAAIKINLIGYVPAVVTNNPPVISNQHFYISEADFSDNIIGSVIATDKNPGQRLSYTIVSGNESGIFAINSQTGILTTTNSNSFGPMDVTYELTIKVTDSATEPESASAKITIKLIGESKIVYIDPENFNDALANGSISHPYASWKDIVWEEGHTYLQKRGTAASTDKILIGANKVTLGAYGEGNLPVISSNTNTYLISGFEKAGITVRELNLQAPNAVSSIYFLGNTSDSTIVEYCQLNANVNAIKVANGNKLVVRYNTISSNFEGVYSSAADNHVYYNIFKNCQEGVNIMGNSAVARISNNVFYNNDESLAVTYADLTLFNNIFYMNSPGQKAFSIGSGKLQSNNNIYYPEQAGFITIANTVYNSMQQLQQALNVDMNSFISDPVFVDIYNDNFLLAKNSPAINAGIDLNLGIDLLGSSVPLSGAADIGVHEFTGIIAPREDAGSHSLRLYPNPSNGKFNVLAEISKESSNHDSEISHIRVIDLTGKTVFARQLEQINETTYHEQIDLTGIANGMYMVLVEIADKIIKEKLIINR